MVLTHVASMLKTAAEQIRLIYSADGGVDSFPIKK